MQFDTALRELVQAQLAALQVVSLSPGPNRSAAVAVVLIEEGLGADLPGMPLRSAWGQEAAFVLTRRPQAIRRHPGQWALPGGRIDDDETPEVPEEAVLRELNEEVGLQLTPSDVIGRLDDVVTKSGFVVTPVILWGGAACVVSLDPVEVASIHRIPLAELMRPDAPWLETSQGTGGTVLKMPIGDTWIAAPTGSILYQFREVCIAGRCTRVAHYEHPEFAWK